VEVSLQQPWLGIGTIGGSRFSLPSLRGSDYEVPFRHGMSHRAKYASSRTISLVMWVAGIDQASGQPSADQVLAWNDNFHQIMQMFWLDDVAGSVQGILTRRWRLTVGGVPTVVAASAMAEVAGSMNPTMTGRTRADFAVDLLLSDPFFYGQVPVAATLAPGVAQPVANPGDSTAGAGYPSAVSAFTVTLAGPLTVPAITVAETGVSLVYAAPIAAGAQVTLDVLNSAASDGSGANVVQFVQHSGSRFWLPLLGGRRGTSTLTLTTLNPADTGTAALQFNPPYV
jgi:hypothetical protein